MNGYLPSIIAVSVLARLIKFALPKDSSLDKYSSFFISLCITAVIAVPAIQIIDSISEIEINTDKSENIESEYSEIFGEYISEALYPSVEEYVYKVLYENFSVPRENAEVFIRFNTSGDVISLEQILIFLKGNSIFANTGAISLYFEEKFLCPVDVSVDIP